VAIKHKGGEKGTKKRKSKKETTQELCGIKKEQRSSRGWLDVEGLSLQASSPDKLAEFVVIHAVNLLRPAKVEKSSWNLEISCRRRKR
jgi:hypothetical protein